MSDINIKMLDLIDKKYTINEMIVELGISREEFLKELRRLKQIGMSFNKRFYSDGEIMYSVNKEIYVTPKNNHVNIITDTGTDSFRVLLISDLHIGNVLESIDAWHKAYDYCAVNNIHNIIIIGDFLDGINIGRVESKIHNHPIEQIEYALANYPFDKNISNFLILGNHDIDSLNSFGIDFSEYLKNYRYDIIPIGYGNGFVNIKNDRILLAHPLGIGVQFQHDLTSNFLLVKGHQHVAKSIIGANNNCSLTVPSLSNMFITENEFLPGAVALTIKFKEGYFDMIYYEHLLFGDRVYAVSSTQYSVKHSKDRNFDGPIKYEEDFGKRKIKKK